MLRPVTHWLQSVFSVTSSAKLTSLVIALPFGHRLRIKLRRFRTSSACRSRTSRQLVLPFRVFGYHEVSFLLYSKRHRGRGRKQTPKAAPLSQIEVMLFTIIVAFGFLGLFHFGVQALGSTVKPDLTLPQSSYHPPALEISSSDDLNETVAGFNPSRPVRVSIDSIDMQASVGVVGLNPNNTLETPPLNQQTTGWYKHSPTPGEIGPSILVGHVDTYEGPSVFYRLREVSRGDVVDVEREDGSVVRFKVTDVRQFNQQAFPTERVYGDIDHAGIRLITCGGRFDTLTGRYTHNTVVYGEMMDMP